MNNEGQVGRVQAMIESDWDQDAEGSVSDDVEKKWEGVHCQSHVCRRLFQQNSNRCFYEVTSPPAPRKLDDLVCLRLCLLSLWIATFCN